MTGESERFATATLPEEYDYLAPDGSEIRHLVAGERGNAVHCTLPPGGVSSAVRHETVEELWYVLGGEGELWRSDGRRESVVDLRGGVGVAIPPGVSFQFRSTGDSPLCLLITTMPPWPGEAEATAVPDHWPVD